MASISSPLYVPRHRDDDEISLISMRELAPSPEDDEHYYSEESSPSTPTTSKAPPLHSTATLNNSLSIWLSRTQKYSSYAFLTFLGIHGTTSALSPLILGTESANSTLLLARTYFYQSTPSAELLLIPGSLLLHITSGLALRAHRHRQQKMRYGGRAPHSISQWRWSNASGIARAGWIAVPLVTVHAALMRVLPWWVDGDSSQVGLEYAAYGFFWGKWGKWTGGIFYGAFVSVVSYHVVFGCANYLKISEKRRRIVMAAALGTAAVWWGGLARVAVESGKVGGYLGRHYDQLYGVFFRLI